MKKFLCVAVALCLAQGFGMSSAMAAKTMKLGIVTNKDRSLSKGLVKFGQIVEKETKGEIKVQVFTDGVLGGDRQTIEALQMGTVHGTSVSTGPIAAFVPQFDVFDLPFLFKDKPTAFRVVDGPFGQDLLNMLPKVGLIGLNYWENGFRHLTNNRRDVKTLEDIKGQKDYNCHDLSSPLADSAEKSLSSSDSLRTTSVSIAPLMKRARYRLRATIMNMPNPDITPTPYMYDKGIPVAGESVCVVIIVI